VPGRRDGQEWEVAMMLRPRRTVRMRLTILYCALFVLSAVVLLAIAYGLGSIGGVATEPRSFGGTAADGRAHQLDAWVVSAYTSASHQFLVGSAIALGVMAVVSVAAGWVIAGRVLRPLRVMTATTRRISADSLHERLAIDGPGDELKDLADLRPTSGGHAARNADLGFAGLTLVLTCVEPT
jgi:HAMP domain-containing protein